MDNWTIAGSWLAATLVVLFVVQRWSAGRRHRERLLERPETYASDAFEEQGRISRWLFLAGYRGPHAASNFVLATFACIVMSALAAWWSTQSGLFAEPIDDATGVPGGLGDLAIPLLIAGPWIVVAIGALVPWSIVRSNRRKRVESVERELPVTLELLATMSESGLGFDGSLSNVLESKKDSTALTGELELFQTEVLAGVPRIQCFRRMSRRLEVPSMSIFVSALVHAERLGAGISSVLRTQADDLRKRRREKANTLAQALPVKLVFPLILCFLPGIFVTTLGPAFLQFVRMAESLTGG